MARASPESSQPGTAINEIIADVHKWLDSQLSFYADSRLVEARGEYYF
jgi:hypothetical protein